MISSHVPHTVALPTKDEALLKQLQELGYRSVFDIVRDSQGRFVSKFSGYHVEEIKGIYILAEARAHTLLNLHRAMVARSEPVMQGIAKLGINPQPEALSAALRRALNDAPDFAELFPERSLDGYAEALSIQSLFSPGRYLVELYKIAQGLHTPGSPLNIDRRRPDIGQLVLSNKNMDERIPTIDILLNILSSNNTTVADLATVFYPMTLPYEDNLVQSRQVLAAQGGSLQALWAALDDTQWQAFSPPAWQAPDPAVDDRTPSPPTREQLRLTVGAYALLVSAPADAAQIQTRYHLPSADIAPELRPLPIFTDRTGLSFNEVIAMTGQQSYQSSDAQTLSASRYYAYGQTRVVPVTEYGQTYLSGATATPLLVVPAGTDVYELNLSDTTAVGLADRAERLLRLQRQIRLDYTQLDWLIRNVNQAIGRSEWKLDTPVLAALAEYSRLAAAYGITADAFACFIGTMNTYARANHASLFQSLFTSPSDGNTAALDGVVDFTPAASNSNATLISGGLGVSANDLYTMAQLAFDTATPVAVQMDAGRYAQLYRLATIPRMLGIGFSDARVLWSLMEASAGQSLAKIIAGAPTLETLEVIERTEAVLAWMGEYQLTLANAVAMTSQVYAGEATAEVFNYVQNIYTTLSSDSAALDYTGEEPPSEDLREKLCRVMAGAFSLKANVLRQLVDWQDLHFTVPMADGDKPYGLGNFWVEIKQLFMTQQELKAHPDLVRYSNATGQGTLIARWGELTEQDLSLLVQTPARFMDLPPGAVAPSPSLQVLLMLSRLKTWQQRVIVPEATAMHYFMAAAAEGEQEALAQLAYIHGWTLEATVAMNACLVDAGIYATYPQTFQQLDRLETWMQASGQLNVGSSGMAKLYRMGESEPEGGAPVLIAEAAAGLVAGASASATATAMQSILEQRRDALVAYYIANSVPEQLKPRIKTADDLYEYLLIDTKISSVVSSSQVAEAISSVQLCINRCLGGYDPDVDNAPGSTMVQESRPGGFLYDWADYNQIYPTWAGKERLQYYASMYINPKLRYGKTVLFNALEETIDQGRITEFRIDQAFEEYLLSFEELANLRTISGYQAGSVSSPSCQDMVYFVGRSDNTPSKFYCRSCNMAIRDDDGNLAGGAWSQWLKINAPVEDAYDGFVSPCWGNNRLYLCWLTRKESGSSGSDTAQTPSYTYIANIWYLQKDGSWVPYRQVPYTAEGVPQKMWAQYEVNIAHLAVYAESLKDGVYTTYQYQPGQPWTWVSTGKQPEGLIYTEVPYAKLKVGDIIVPPPMSDPVNRWEVIALSDSQLTLSLRPMSSASNYVLAIMFFDYAGVEFKDSQVDTGLVYPGDSVPPFTVDISGCKYILCSRNFNGKPSTAYYVYSANPPPVIGVFSIKDGQWLYQPDISAPPSWDYPIGTSAAPYFAALLQEQGINGLLRYATQTAPIEQGGTQPIDFNGSYGLYFWEIFFYNAFLIADRYLTEQNFGQSTLWYQYLFNYAGYRNADGELEKVDGEIRYWNVVPLQQDHAWNRSIPPTVDPDVIAMNDPMQFKLAVFSQTVNLLIAAGDYAYRQLQPDTLARAKMFYVQASQLLGTRPVIDINDSWSNPTVGEEATQVAVFNDDNPDTPAPTWLTQAARAWLAEQNGSFLPPYNADLLIYWDKLEIRLYNLRHGLSLDGQPLALPLYAAPVSPQSLQRKHGAGNGAGGNSVSAALLGSQFRFSVLLERARVAVGSVIQFGNALQAALDRRDSESMTLLMQTQQQQVLAQTVQIQTTNLGVLQNSLMALQEAKKGAELRLAHYGNLYENWISGGEEAAMNLQTAAATMIGVAQPLYAIAGGLDVAPNIFGLAVGGSEWAAPVRAAAMVLEGVGRINEIASTRLNISEQYRRRRQDWQIQMQSAGNEVAQLSAQIASQEQQLVMAEKQQALAQLELANQQAVYNLLSTRFTGMALFTWLTGRLSALYYQLYDATLPLCLAAKTALVRELGEQKTQNLFTAPAWNDLYQGLLAGESLLLELQKMDNTYLHYDVRGLEIQKTVSLNTQISGAPQSTTSFPVMLQAALDGDSPPSVGGVAMAMQAGTKLVIVLDIATLRLAEAYGVVGKIGRFKSISVTLPTLLGPYQDIEATLGRGDAAGQGVFVPLSRGLDDAGVFMLDLNDPRYLPFEGTPVAEGTLILTLFHAEPVGAQRTLIENLNDVIYQLRYTLKDY
ncbi:Tc toxin subunit A [Massilia sp. YIM B04103]|uniref:Tc toxin subunit A-related protein n=1 Tax=Massilia sp. YIM B04103 TaxID=2963106 RepID=UPI00210E967D|nr:neuraminidase-like domain-containing protein [Massilia sp. YIM B04103]